MKKCLQTLVFSHPSTILPRSALLVQTPKRQFIFGRFFKRGEPTKTTTDQQLKSELSEGDDGGIYEFDISAIDRKEKELLEKYPEYATRIKKAMEEPDIKQKKEHEMSVEEISVYRAHL